MYYNNKRVIVTGASGLVGQNLVRRLLSDGAIVTAIYNNTPLNLFHENLNIIQCNLMDFNSCKTALHSCDIVINCASIVKSSVNNVQNESQYEFIHDSMIMLTNIITAAVKNKIPKFAFISSSTLYPNANYAIHESEGFDGEPWLSYRGVGNITRYIESLCKYYNDISSTRFVICRTTALYGPYDNYNLSSCHIIPATIIKSINKVNPFVVYGNGKELRNFLYIDDFIDGLLILIELCSDADAINISTSEISCVNDVVKICNHFENHNPIIQYVNDTNAIPCRIVSVEMAQSTLKWKAKINLRDGIYKTICWYKNEYNRKW